MKKHEILSQQSRAALFDPPTDPAAIVRHYTLSPEDLALVRRRRRDANRIGFAVHLAYLRFPGRVPALKKHRPRMFFPSSPINSTSSERLSINMPAGRKRDGNI
jgi:TnpA family transposase